MKLPVNKRPSARADVVEIAAYIGIDSPDAAASFLAAAEATFSFLGDWPEAGRLMPVRAERLRGLRRWTIREFPAYQIVYRVTTEGVDVLRILHSARNVGRILRRDL